MNNFNQSSIFDLRAGRVSTGKSRRKILSVNFKCSNRNFETPGQAAQACLEGICSCSSYIQVVPKIVKNMTYVLWVNLGLAILISIYGFYKTFKKWFKDKEKDDSEFPRNSGLVWSSLKSGRSKVDGHPIKPLRY